SASDADLLDNTFSNNTAYNQGGGIYIGAGCSPAISYCTISPSNSAVQGGGIHVPSNYLAPIEDSTVSNNVASSEGGGIYMGSNSSPPITNCVISSNESGGIYMGDDCSPSISDCTINGNTGAARGGGIRLGDRCSPPIDSSSISYNTSSGEGGGIYMSADCSPSIADCEIDGNSASTKGGAVYVGTDSMPTLTSCSMNTNACDAAGGAVAFVGSGNAAICNCELNVNTAGTDGGAVLCEAGAFPSFSDCVMKYNEAGLDGGAIACFGDSDPLLQDNLLTNNTAAEYGGAIYCTGGSSPRLEAANMIQWNEAGDAGGAIYCSDSASPYVFCALIEENSAANLRGVGAGIACYSSSSPEFWSCTIEGNRKGGVYATGGAAPTLTNCIIWNNDDDVAGVSCDHISHCCIEDGDCAGQNGNIADDPLLVPLPMRPCYLSHEDAGQSQSSPCIDAGLGQSSDYGLDQCTVRTDGELDTGAVDIGFHYELGLNSYYVDSENGDNGASGRKGYPWKTITYATTQEGLGTEESPAFIQVAPGRYDYQNNQESFPLKPRPWTALLGAGAEDDENTGSIVGDGDHHEPFDFRIYGGYASIGGFWIRGGDEYGVRCVDSQSVVIHDCVITEVQAKGDGAVYLENTTDTRLLRCKITGNQDTSHSGAGLVCFYGNPRIEYCEITNNDSVYRGAGVILDRSTATFLGCIISGNTSGESGAGVSTTAGFTMRDCTISDNTADGTYAYYGGGMMISRSYSGERLLINCVISGNKVTRGAGTSVGGGAMFGGPVVALDCIFEGNVCDAHGGAIYFDQDSTQRLENCLIIGNSAGTGSSAGGAIYCHGTSNPELINCTIEGNDTTGVYGTTGTGLTLTNCIVWNNGDDIVNVDCSQISHCDIQDDDCNYDEDINLNQDPIFMPRDPNDIDAYTGYYLAQQDAQAGDSPCINEGDDQASAYGLEAYTTCTDGRFDEDVVDIGYHYPEAYEGEDNTYIELISFEAIADGSAIKVTWETGTEIDNAGFDLYRTEAGEISTAKKLNDRMIPARGSAAAGASYEFADRNVKISVIYSYYLIDIDTSGKATAHGPVEARVLSRPVVIPDERLRPEEESKQGDIFNVPDFAGAI
ncbi:MAG: right-handed parallel beta-helix repeat-containing protein, partial [Candidatus Coatesbacteria bacterium]|nr:right-handed parallel beta-helix repeat-containing protein [Candidatus Coatesbacteria bacterium]